MTRTAEFFSGEVMDRHWSDETSDGTMLAAVPRRRTVKKKSPRRGGPATARCITDKCVTDRSCITHKSCVTDKGCVTHKGCVTGKKTCPCRQPDTPRLPRSG